MPDKKSATDRSSRQTFAALGGLGSFLLFMFGLMLFFGYSQATESTGMLWWSETHEVPMSERVGYLQGAIVCWVAAAILGGVTIWLTVIRRARGDRLRRYVPILKGVESIPVQQVASIVNVQPARVYQDIQQMIDSGMIEDFYLDYQTGQIISKKYTPESSHKTVATCPSCGARSEVIVGITRPCVYCGQPLPV